MFTQSVLVIIESMRLTFTNTTIPRRLPRLLTAFAMSSRPAHSPRRTNLSTRRSSSASSGFGWASRGCAFRSVTHAEKSRKRGATSVSCCCCCCHRRSRRGFATERAEFWSASKRKTLEFYYDCVVVVVVVVGWIWARNRAKIRIRAFAWVSAPSLMTTPTRTAASSACAERERGRRRRRRRESAA